MEPGPGEHIEISCKKCKHRARHHAAGQFVCIVPGCTCNEMDPVEKIVKDEDQADIISVDEDGQSQQSGQYQHYFY